MPLCCVLWFSTCLSVQFKELNESVMKLIVHWNKLTQLYVIITTWDDCLSANGETLKIGVSQTHQCIYILIRNHIKITQHWRDFVIDVFKLSHLGRSRLLPWHAPAFKPLHPQTVVDTIYGLISVSQRYSIAASLPCIFLFFFNLWIYLYIYSFYSFIFYFYFLFFLGGGGPEQGVYQTV